MIEAIVAKATAGLTLRLETVVQLAASAVAVLVLAAGNTHQTPLAVLGSAAEWLGLYWSDELRSAHGWLALRSDVVLDAALVITALALMVGWSLAGKGAGFALSRPRWAMGFIGGTALAVEVGGQKYFVVALATLLALTAVRSATSFDGGAGLAFPFTLAIVVASPVLMLISLMSGDLRRPTSKDESKQAPSDR